MLLLFGIPYFTVRYIPKSLNLWKGAFDAVGLAAISLLLFVNDSKSSFAIFMCEIIFNYVMVLLMLRQEKWQAKEIDIAILAYFKYLNFFVEDILGLVVPGLSESWQSKSIPGMGSIPLGLSFYTFQMVRFVVDSYTTRNNNPLLLYITSTLFPFPPKW